ncbi:MAG: cupin domain-containing protein [Oscillospiraceae bacterium]|nr:cupin domain-containing protein [Oscillospiraceae bacterium]
MIVRNESAVQQTPAPGVHRKVLSYSDSLMACEVTLDKGAVVPAHHHPETQVSYMISGSCRVKTERETIVLQAGDSILFAPDESHEIFCQDGGKILDVFSPMRKDFLD